MNCHPMLRRRKPSSAPPAIDKIMAERRIRNSRVWRRFLAQRLNEAWSFVFGRPCKCPPLDLEPTVFRERLGLRTTEDELHTDLELAVRRKLAGEAVTIRWHTSNGEAA